MNAKYPQLIILHFPCLGGGNAAGFLAKRGLLMSGGGRGHEKENNSSDTDSDTEEYLSNVHRYLTPKYIYLKPMKKKCILMQQKLKLQHVNSNISELIL